MNRLVRRRGRSSRHEPAIRGRRLPDASVDTEAEADIAVWSSIGNERERVLERIIVPVCRRMRHQEMIARPDRLATERIGLGGCPEEMLDR